jgi:ubiquitin-like protein Pup
MAQQKVSRGDHRPADTARGDSRRAGERRKPSEDVDRLIDEIDAVLEENAAEFVKGYVQRGGE